MRGSMGAQARATEQDVGHARPRRMHVVQIGILEQKERIESRQAKRGAL